MTAGRAFFSSSTLAETRLYICLYTQAALRSILHSSFLLLSLPSAILIPVCSSIRASGHWPVFLGSRHLAAVLYPRN